MAPARGCPIPGPRSPPPQRPRVTRQLRELEASGDFRLAPAQQLRHVVVVAEQIAIAVVGELPHQRHHVFWQGHEASSFLAAEPWRGGSRSFIGATTEQPTTSSNKHVTAAPRKRG